MNRRTLLRTAGVAGSLSVAGCLEAETEPTETDSEDGAPRYGQPAYSSWPPVTSHSGGGVVSYHLELSRWPAIQQAVSDDRVDSTQPLFSLPLSAVEQITAAVESLSSYPFAAALRKAVNTAATASSQQSLESLVETPTEPIHPANESIADPSGNETTDTDSDTTHSNETVTDGGDGNETVADDQPPNTSNERTNGDDPPESEPDPLSAADLGIELEAVTLTDGLLVFEGSFDRTAILEQFGEQFQQVDSQRGISIYEGQTDKAGLAFGLTNSRFFVPTEDSSRSVDGERVLAHVLSGYISTLNRIVDDTDGQWLFETTGSGALSICGWELSDQKPLLAETPVSETRSDDLESVFESGSSSCCTLSATVDSERLASVEVRFSGLYPAGPPAEEQLESSLVGDGDLQTVFHESPRAHVTAVFDDL